MPTLKRTVENVKDTALEVGVYLPLGAYATARDRVVALNTGKVKRLYGNLVDRGQERLRPIEGSARRRRQQIEREARRRRQQVEEAASRTSSEVRSTARRATGSAKERAADTRQTARKTAAKAEATADAVVPKMPRVTTPKNARELAIDDYDNRTAGEIASAAKGLTQTELAKIYKYERANQDRATVLEAIETKFVDLPIPTYDALSADEIVGRLEGLDDGELKKIRRYEAATKARITILDKIDASLGASV